MCTKRFWNRLRTSRSTPAKWRCGSIESKDSEVSALKIVPYSNEKQQVVNLLVELQEYLVSADEERVQTIDDAYGEKYFAYLQGLIKKHEGIILLAVSGNEVVGFIAGYIEPKDEEDIITNRCPKRGIISDLAVTAPRRGSGIGKDLMNAIERYFMEMDCEFVALDLFAPNDTAKKFYDSLGYTPRNIELYKRIKR
mgnify:FL=1